MASAAGVVAAARVYVAAKARYCHQARGPFAFDCLGILVRAFADDGVQLPDRIDYERVPQGAGPGKGQLSRELRAVFGPPVTDDLREGDIVSLAWGTLPHHVGLVANHPQGGLSLIHCSASIMLVCEQRIDEAMIRMVREVFRYRF